MRLLRTLYERLGPRYPRIALLAGLPTAFLTAVVATLATALYVDMGIPTFLRLLMASWILIWALEVALEARLIVTRTRPIERWIAGPDRGDGAAAAWHAAAGLPLAFLRDWRLYAAVLPGLLAWGFYASDLLDLEDGSVAIFFGASLLTYLYWVVVRFLAMELVLRPVLEDASRHLPDDAELELLRIPLRLRLLATLPALTLITGVAAGGFSAESAVDLDALGLALLGSVTVAILVSSWLIAFLSTSITTPIAELCEATQAVRDGDYEVRVPLASTDETGQLARSFNEMVAGLQQRERLRDAFGTFVDPQLAERVAEEGTDLAGEEVEVSILFLDVRDFTAYAERVSAREVVARLNELYEFVVPIIVRHRGHANKFVGDGLLAVFGAPARLDDHATAAVRAGLEVAATVRREFADVLRVGIGINSGEVMSGTVGGGGRLDFTVIGDAVNTAARVEAATRETGDDLLITAATRDLVSEGSDTWEERPPIALKGKAGHVRLFGVGPGPDPA